MNKNMLFQDLITGTQNRQKNAINFWNIHNKRQHVRLPPPPSATGSSTPLFCSPSHLSSNKQYTSVDKKNQLDVTFCILYFSSNSCSTCFGQPCAHTNTRL